MTVLSIKTVIVRMALVIPVAIILAKLLAKLRYAEPMPNRCEGKRCDGSKERFINRGRFALMK